MNMKRCDFITFLGGAAAAWPLASRAQQRGLPVVGILSSGALSGYVDLLGAFRQGLKDTGYIEGQNVLIESRWAEGHFERLPKLAAELVQLRAAVIVTTGDSSTFAAKMASATIPHVFLSQDDPVKLGLVKSFNRPGGNATGMSLLTSALVAKRLEFVRQLVPAGVPISCLMNPRAPESESHLSDMQTAARESGQQIGILNAGSEGEIENAFTTLAQRKERSSSAPIRFSPASCTKSPCWRRTSKFRRSTIAASLSRPAASSATVRTFPTHIARLAFMLAGHQRSNAVGSPDYAANQIRAGD